MKKYGRFTLGGIQQKIFNLVLISIILVMAVYSVVIFYQYGHLGNVVQDANERQKQSILRISQDTMNQVVNKSMSSGIRQEARIADDMLASLGGNVRMLADYAERILADPDAYGPHAYAAPDPANEGRTVTQLLTEEGVDSGDPAVAGRLSLLANMSEMMETLYRTNRINACYIATTDGVMLLADDHSAEKFGEDGAVIHFPMRQRSWYTGAAETGGLFFTDVQEDVFTGKIGIMCGMPVYCGGELAGVVGADLYLDAMAETVAASTESGGFLFIVNQNGHVIFSPRTEGLFRVQVADQAKDLRQAEETKLAALVKDALAEQTDVRLVEADGSIYYMTGAPIPTVGWTMICAVEKAVTDQPSMMLAQAHESILNEAVSTVNSNLDSGRRTFMILIIAVLILTVTAALALAGRIVRPLTLMTREILSMGGENLQFRMNKAYKTKDEIEVLAEAFSDLSARTTSYVDQVRTITAEKERIGSELRMATAIQESQVPRLFPAFPQRTEFDLYAMMKPAKEVGGDFYDFFLIDDDHIALVMADVSGKGVPAALFMMVSRVLIKTHLQSGKGPAETLATVNDQLCDSNGTDFFITTWIGVLEISTGRGIAANAGHEHPAVCRRNGKYELVIYSHSPAVGVMNGMVFREHEFRMEPGDSLFVYTDGVAEATDGANAQFGTQRMLDALNEDPGATPESALHHVMDGLTAFVGDAVQFDDITMLCLTYKGPKAP